MENVSDVQIAQVVLEWAAMTRFQNFKNFMKFNYFHKRSLKPGVGNFIINKIEVLISSSAWTWMFTRIQTCPRFKIRARAIIRLNSEEKSYLVNRRILNLRLFRGVLKYTEFDDTKFIGFPGTFEVRIK